MHVLSFGEGRFEGVCCCLRRFGMVRQFVTLVGKPFECETEGVVVSCDFENTLRHRGRAGGNGLRGDSIENLFQRIPEETRRGVLRPPSVNWFFGPQDFQQSVY